MKDRTIRKILIIALAAAFTFSAVPSASYTAEAKTVRKVKTASKKSSSHKKSKKKKNRKKNTVKPAAHVAAIAQPSAISGSSITFADHFTSDSENKLTIRWDPVADAGSYEVDGIVTGTTDEESVITRVNDSSEKQLYSGDSNIAVFTIPRNTMYIFKVRSVNKSGKQKKVSEWTKIDYFPSTDDSETAISNAKIYRNNFGINAKDNTIIHGNVVAITNDFDYTTVSKKFGTDTTDTIIDFSGHTINLRKRDFERESHNFDRIIAGKSVILQDSIGGGGITDHTGHPVNIHSVKTVINGGIYNCFETDDRNYGMCVSFEGSTLTINGGDFSSGYISLSDDTVNINGGHFTYFASTDSANHPSRASIITDGGYHPDKSKCYININSGFFDIPQDTFSIDAAPAKCICQPEYFYKLNIKNITWNTDKTSVTVSE